ncbi:hypothetical protein ES708_15670 [subsurface metagenome]
MNQLQQLNLSAVAEAELQQLLIFLVTLIMLRVQLLVQVQDMKLVTNQKWSFTEVIILQKQNLLHIGQDRLVKLILMIVLIQDRQEMQVIIFQVIFCFEWMVKVDLLVPILLKVPEER